VPCSSKTDRVDEHPVEAMETAYSAGGTAPACWVEVKEHACWAEVKEHACSVAETALSCSVDA
jgi:hypothetical protein